MGAPTFGIFDHIEAIPGTDTARLLRDRLDLVRTADQAGFTGYYLAEHHGSDLCMAPNQDLFVAAASQITEQIRMGPMVKLLPLHHPVQLVEDLCVVDNLTNGRLEYGVGRGVAPIEHFWFGSDWPSSTDRFEDVLGIICRALRTGGLNLMWPGPISQEAYDLYASTWDEHRNTDVRLDAPDAQPRVACTMVVAIDHDEDRAHDVITRGMNGLIRRTHGVHRWDAEVLGEDAADAALGPLRRIMSHIDGAIEAGHGTPDQITDRFGHILDAGLTDHIVLQVPTGDMTMDEARRTMDLFCAEVKPQFDRAA